MTTISLQDWMPSPDILVGEKEHKRLTVAALTDIGHDTDSTDFLLYELDRARVVADAALPPDVVRLGSVVRYRPIPGEERVIKLVLPEAVGEEQTYRLSVTSSHGAALIGLRAGDIMSWTDPGGAAHRLKVLRVANTPSDDSPTPGAA